MPVKKKAPTQETLAPTPITTVFQNKDRPLVETMVHTFTKEPHTFTWNESNDRIDMNIKDVGVVYIEFPDTPTGDFKVTIPGTAKAWLDNFVKIQNMDIKQNNLDESVFRDIPLQKLKAGEFASFGKNLEFFNNLNTYFKGLGITRVGWDRYPYNRISDAAADDITLIFYPLATGDEQADDFDGQFDTRYMGLPGYRSPSRYLLNIITVGKEKVVPLKVDGILIGNYYPERNIVTIGYSPFQGVDVKGVNSFTEVPYLKKALEDIQLAITEAKVKKVDNKKFKTLLLVHAFNKQSRMKLSDLQRTAKETEKNLHSYEAKIIQLYNDRITLNKQIAAIGALDDDAIDMFLEAIEKARTMPIVEKVSLEDGCVNITYKPTTIKAPVTREYTNDKQAGVIHEMYLGRITAKISGSGNITVVSDMPTKDGMPHPHARKDGQPCLGHGEGVDMMLRLIGERNFADFIYVFWMWIKRWRPEDCYVSPPSFMDDRLQQGLPVFNAMGQRVTLDTVVLPKDVKIIPAENYKANTELFKDFGPQP